MVWETDCGCRWYPLTNCSGLCLLLALWKICASNRDDRVLFNKRWLLKKAAVNHQPLWMLKIEHKFMQNTQTQASQFNSYVSEFKNFALKCEFNASQSRTCTLWYWAFLVFQAHLFVDSWPPMLARWMEARVSIASWHREVTVVLVFLLALSSYQTKLL